MTNLAAPDLPPAARLRDPDEPSSGLVFDLESDVLPSGLTALVKPMLGPAERAYRASMKARGPAAVDKTAEALLLCIDKIDGAPATLDAVMELCDEDIRALFLRIRRAGFPESTVVPFEWTCAPPFVAKGAGCEHENKDRAFDIAGLEFVTLSTVRSFALRFDPFAGKTLAWRPVTLSSQKAYAASRRSETAIDLDALVFSRKAQLDGKNLKPSDWDRVHPTDKSAVRKLLLTPAGINSIVEDACGRCGMIMRVPAEALPGFFWPEAVGA